MRLSYFGCFAAICLGACSTVPKFEDEQRINVETVVHRIKCELLEARDKHPWLQGWAASVTLTLQIVDKGSAGGELGFVVPISAGTFSIGFSAGATETATRTVSVEFDSKVRGLKPGSCVPPDSRADHSLRGALGLAEWVQRVESTVRSPDVLPDKEKAIGYNLDFQLVLEGSVTPAFKIVPVSGRERSGSLKLAQSRDDLHKVEIALTPDPTFGVQVSAPAKKRLSDTKTNLRLQNLRLSPR